LSHVLPLKAVVFDLFKTLGEFSHTVTDEDVSELLLSRGYPVYPQAWRHAFNYTVFIDYPKYGYESHEALLVKTFQHLEVFPDESTIHEVAALFRDSPFVLYVEAFEAVRRVKDLGLKTAIATSTPKPFFIKGLGQLGILIDFICTGYEAGCEKSNPQMYKVILDRLGLEPFEALVLGDDPVLDVVNSKMLGMKAIHIVQEGVPMDQADGVARNVLEAVKLIESWV